MPGQWGHWRGRGLAILSRPGSMRLVNTFHYHQRATIFLVIDLNIYHNFLYLWRNVLRLKPFFSVSLWHFTGKYVITFSISVRFLEKICVKGNNPYGWLNCVERGQCSASRQWSSGVTWVTKLRIKLFFLVQCVAGRRIRGAFGLC